MIKKEDLIDAGKYWVLWSDGKNYLCDFDGTKVTYPFSRKRGHPIGFMKFGTKKEELLAKRTSLL